MISWTSYDPDHQIDPTSTFYGDFINYNARVADMRDAATAGAKGILFTKDEPRGQLRGRYEPYEGTAWKVPGAFLGVDEGAKIQRALSHGKRPTARLAVRARFTHVVTPSILATIPGRSPKRLVIDSHTDGTNAVEDNGPIAMVAMAQYLASLPMRCRPRTVEFSFSTAHFYQRVADPAVRDGGASSSPNAWTTPMTAAPSPPFSCSSTSVPSTTKRSPGRVASPGMFSGRPECGRSSSSA